jgi:hypothetical protein
MMFAAARFRSSICLWSGATRASGLVLGSPGLWSFRNRRRSGPETRSRKNRATTGMSCASLTSRLRGWAVYQGWSWWCSRLVTQE